MELPSQCDVLVAGSGNAGFSAAVAAKQAGARSVIVIDKCPEAWTGGNSFFTAGAMRAVHNGLNDVLPIVNNVEESTASTIDMEPYTESDFLGDLERVCSGRSDPDLARILVRDSNSAVKWLASNGIRFQLSFNRQAYKVDGRQKFWGGMVLKTQDGGKGLMEDHRAAAKRHGIAVYYTTPLVRLITDPQSGAVVSAVVKHRGLDTTIRTGAVILAAGGFESNPRMRTRFLGPGWDLARVRGTPYNMGDCFEIALRDVSARPAGNWSGCHSVAWDAEAPFHTGDREISNEFTKSGYPLGLMINNQGKRFVDEGIDLRNYTYAKFGRAILQQPNQTAFQIWDSRMTPWLRAEEYREERVRRITADSIENLASRLSKFGLEDQESFVSTMKDYNQAVYAFQAENEQKSGASKKKWDPAIRDGISTQSSSTRLPLAKSNWALPVDKAPFVAVKVTCGITFTFGGLAVVPETAQVLSELTNKPIAGLYCAGEMLGGLFYDNYPGGSGLTSGAVFGRRAGREAAASAAKALQVQSKL